MQRWDTHLRSMLLYKSNSATTNQEDMIRALYEKFKEHKKCSYMIANALDADNKFTAVQVSHKLKQLGLRVPQQKKFEANMLIKNENSNSLFIDKAHDPDDETLSLLLNRSHVFEIGTH
ncbi:hypothetical protein ACB092_07G140700 [Castanea dentata]